MDDAEFRRRAHALLDDLATEGNVRRSDAWAGGDEANALIAAGPSSGLPVAGCPCETCKAKPATDPDAPVRIVGILEDPAVTAKPWFNPFLANGGVGPPGATYLRPSLIVLATAMCVSPGQGATPIRYVRLELSNGVTLYVWRHTSFDGGGIYDDSPCRAIPEPWRNV